MRVRARVRTQLGLPTGSNTAAIAIASAACEGGDNRTADTSLGTVAFLNGAVPAAIAGGPPPTTPTARIPAGHIYTLEGARPFSAQLDPRRDDGNTFEDAKRAQ